MRVIGPELCSELNRLAGIGEIIAERRLYQQGDLKGALIVIAATDKQDTNLDIMNGARRMGILVNVVDTPDYSDFIAPSSLKRGDITIAVSTAGRSPALARKIRERLEKDFGEEYAALAILISEVRTELKNHGVKVDSEKWQKALDLDLLITLLKVNDRERARELLLNNLKR